MKKNSDMIEANEEDIFRTFDHLEQQRLIGYQVGHALPNNLPATHWTGNEHENYLNMPSMANIDPGMAPPFKPTYGEIKPTDNPDSSVDKGTLDITSFHKLLSMTTQSDFTCSPHVSDQNQHLPDDTIKIMTEFYQRPGVIHQMIKNLHGDIEKSYNLITLLRSFLRSINIQECNTCKMQVVSGSHSRLERDPIERALLEMLKQQSISETATPNIIGQQYPHCKDILSHNVVSAEAKQDSVLRNNINNDIIDDIIDGKQQQMKAKKRTYRKSKNVGPFECSITKCNKVFTSKTGLRQHFTESHTVNQMYCCGECDFKTKLLKNLNGHLVSHHKKEIKGLKIFICQFCDYKCVDKQRLAEHESTHTGVKKFRCADCSKDFATKRGLRSHLKFHSADRPYKCLYCDATFKIKPKLRDHIRLIHTNKGEKPYKCGYCSHRASVRGNVNQHIKNMHQGRPVMVLKDKTLVS